MPCYDGRDNRRETVYVDKLVYVPSNAEDINIYKQQVATLVVQMNAANTRAAFAESKSNLSDAILCALMSELKKHRNFETVVFNASTNGQVDVIKYAKSHTTEDRAKLMDFVKPLSQDELSLLKSMLTEGGK